jgi:hypothetical protein
MDTAALIDRMVDSYNRHDTEAQAPCYAPDARVHPAGQPEAVDAGTWLAAVGLVLQSFPDLQLHPRNLAADDRVALLEARLTGTNTGPFTPGETDRLVLDTQARDAAGHRARHGHHWRGRARGRRRPGDGRAALLAAGRHPRAAGLRRMITACFTGSS